MKKTLTLILIFTLSSLAGAVPVYRMGVVLPVSGEQGQIGKDIQEGIEVFLSYMKESNGFQSFLLKATLFDTESKTENAKKILDFISEKTDQWSLLAGGVDSETSSRLKALAEEKNIPYLFPLAVTFRDPAYRNTFPLLPSLYSGFKFILRFFQEKNLSVKVIYDDSTKNDAFVLTSSENLLDYQDEALKNDPPKVAVIFVSDDHVEKVLAKTQGLSFRVLNYHQSNLIQKSQDKTLWEDTIFINWVKPETSDAVKFFQDTFLYQKKKKANNYHMLGWILADAAYETLFRVTGKKNDAVNHDEIIREMERFSQTGGYDGGCGYQIYYAPFNLSDPSSRLGISGFYFMKYRQGSWELISEFYSLLK